MSDDVLFQTTQIGDTIVVEPTRNMGEFEMAEIDATQDSAFQQLVRLAGTNHVVMDLGQTDYFGSSTIGLFNRFVNHVKAGDRRIAFCNLSKHEQEIIDITRMNQLWEVRQTRDEALAYVTAAG
ncbi:MAG: STAS domain-containing protein [Planctomycetaceae bacterium]